ncbi:MAG: peptidase S9 [Gemmatimonadota bacterium]
MRRLAGMFVPLAAALMVVPSAVDAQYFGRNKVQYDDFDFRVLETPHFDIHYYPSFSEATLDVARMSERWYERFARTFQHEFETSKPLILYADHPDFQQTNTLQGFIGEGTGGVTESMKNRVIMPLTSSYADTDHVLGHELVHAFQYNIAQSRGGGGLQGLIRLPLWLVEGMAEYLSVGREDPLTAMWMRDALLREDFPSIKQMTQEARFFPYRFGQALWAYIGGTYGDDAVVNVYRRSLRIGFPGAIQQVLGVSPDTLSVQWREEVRQTYEPLMDGRTAPSEVGTLILGPETGGGNQNVSPSVSPDGRYVAFVSEKDLFSVDLYLAETATGKILRKLSSANADPHSDALRYIDASGTWSPDGSRFAYVVFADGDNQLVIIDTSDGDVEARVGFDEIGSMNHPAWSPDGRYIAFSGTIGAISDLFMWDLEEQELTQLTNDKHADLQPDWSPDGRMLVFASDRGPGTDFTQLTYSKFQIATLDLATRGVRTLDLLGDVRHSNPQYAPDGRGVYFLSDADGFSDIYRVDMPTGEIGRVTRVATGVSGIVPLSPALSVANDTGEILFSVFGDFGFTIHRLPANSPGEPLNRVVQVTPSDAPGRILPPGPPARFNLVETYLADAETGLEPEGTFGLSEASDYNPSLSLDYLGQPTLGVGADQFGGYVGGGASAYFSDMLGNRIVGVALQAQGTFKDIGGALFYADLGDRWNWTAGISHFPYQFVRQGISRDFETDEDGNEIPVSDPYLIRRRTRLFQSSATAQLSDPFSMTRRLEMSGGFTRYAYDVEDERYYFDNFGRIYDFERVDRDDLEPEAVNLGTASLAFVQDNSFLGFVSPIRGGRYRIEVEATVGSQNFFTGILDWRRYWSPQKNVTIAARGLTSDATAWRRRNPGS